MTEGTTTTTTLTASVLDTVNTQIAALQEGLRQAQSLKQAILAAQRTGAATTRTLATKRGRPVQNTGFRQSILDVVQSGARNYKEIATALRATGWKTTSGNPTHRIYQEVSRLKKAGRLSGTPATGFSVIVQDQPGT